MAAGDLVVVCLLDDASVGEALADVDLTGKDLVNLTTGTPAQGRGARFLDGGIMAVPPMIGVPDSGGYVLYSGSRALFDVALLSAMTGMFAGFPTPSRCSAGRISRRRSSPRCSSTG